MRISLVTPVLDARDLLAFTMESVFRADPGDLQYVVMDGGSRDGSREFAEAQAHRLHAVESASDRGVYDAIAKGFARTDGEIMGWINAGDLIFPDALSIVREIFAGHPEIAWITSRVLSFLDESGRLVEQGLHQGVARESYLAGEHLEGFSSGRTLSLIQQESTFWRRSLWQRAGGRFDPDLTLAADFELWARFFAHAELWSVSAPLGAFRRHAGQLSQVGWPRYLAEAKAVLTRGGARPRGRVAQSVSVGLRRLLPGPLRPLAHRAGLFAPAPVLSFDQASGSWRARAL